jgi:hypothetical protein
MNRPATPRRHGALALFLSVLCAAAAVAGELTDEQFLETLGQGSTVPVDQWRLAKVLFGMAATLDSGKSTVQGLHGKLVVPETSLPSISALLRSRYDEYTRSLERFRSSVSRLLDDPASALLLHRALVDGQRACWHLDLHQRLVETYSAATADLTPSLASRETCGRLREAAFQPRVEAIVQEALVQQQAHRVEVEALQQQVRELERLVEDLMAIESKD